MPVSVKCPQLGNPSIRTHLAASLRDVVPPLAARVRKLEALAVPVAVRQGLDLAI